MSEQGLTREQVKIWDVVTICDLFQRFQPIPASFVTTEDYRTLQAELEQVRREKRKSVELCESLVTAQYVYVKDIATLKQQLAEAMDHAAGMSNDVTHLGEQLAAREERVKELEEALSRKIDRILALEREKTGA